jgi:hypothetical protein
METVDLVRHLQQEVMVVFLGVKLPATKRRRFWI